MGFGKNPSQAQRLLLARSRPWQAPGTDIDPFISLKRDTPLTLEDIYWKLFEYLKG